MQNPFVYGEVVPSDAFADRVDELERLVGDLLAGQKVFLISPRRFGKSSLIHRALAAVERQGALTVDVTVSSFSSYIAFLEGYARAVLSVETRWDRAKAWMQEAVRSTRVDIRMGADPLARGSLADPAARSVAVSFPNARTERDVARLAEEVFQLPARLAQSKRKHVVVALDEFQAIAKFDGESVEHALRAAVQHQRSVGYVFAGSEPSLMERMISPKRPFYKAGPVLRLERIPPDEFAAWIEDRFVRSGLKVDAGLGHAIVELGGNLPYDVQRLAHEAWDQTHAAGRRKATADDLHDALRRLLSTHDVMFEGLWERLTLAQRATLRAVVLEEGREILSADVRSRHRLPSTSTVQTALGALVRDDVIAREGSRYVVVDSLFREWVARQTY